MTFTTNKSGKYKIESANFSINNVTIPSIFDASANTPITVTCTTNTWSEKAKITISHVEVDEDNEVSKTIGEINRYLELIGTMDEIFIKLTVFS
jgi:hypothetical protein